MINFSMIKMIFSLLELNLYILARNLEVLSGY